MEHCERLLKEQVAWGKTREMLFVIHKPGGRRVLGDPNGGELFLVWPFGSYINKEAPFDAKPTCLNTALVRQFERMKNSTMQLSMALKGAVVLNHILHRGRSLIKHNW